MLQSGILYQRSKITVTYIGGGVWKTMAVRNVDAKDLGGFREEQSGVWTNYFPTVFCQGLAMPVY